ncbi:MAG: diacylglycerol kinase family lipid kinase, partial [Cytophagaceae bacterium]|nr:diacylglycerol kinase family lipid kinase [Cytophagaceae bacterium]
MLILDVNEHEATLRHWIKTWKPARIVAVGGDGTVKLVYEQILGSRVVLG